MSQDSLIRKEILGNEDDEFLDDEDDEEPDYYWAWGIFVAAAVTVVWAVVGFGPFWYSKYNYPSEAGTFGDTFGFVNSLFSGLALGGVVFAIYLQTKELRLQRRELKSQRNEMKQQVGLMERSGRIQSLTAAWQHYKKISDEYKEKKLPIYSSLADGRVRWCMRGIHRLVDKSEGIDFAQEIEGDLRRSLSYVWSKIESAKEGNGALSIAEDEHFAHCIADVLADSLTVKILAEKLSSPPSDPRVNAERVRAKLFRIYIVLWRIYDPDEHYGTFAEKVMQIREACEATLKECES